MRTIRHQINARPLMMFAVCFVLGTVVGYQNAVGWGVWCALSAVCAALLLIRRRRAYLLCGGMFIGAMLVTLALIRPEVYAQKNVQLRGTIADVPRVSDQHTRVLIENASLDGQTLSCGVMLYIYPSQEDELPISSLEYGMMLCAEVNTRVPDGASNPMGYDYGEYLWRQGVALTASASSDEIIILSAAEPSLESFFIDCRSRIEQVILDLYDEQTAPIVCALVIGDRSLMPDEMYEQFRISGLAHLLAISGLHIGCLAAALDFLLRRLRCPKGLVFALVMIFLLFYAALVGFPASICRAVIMYAIGASARLFSRRADGFTSLGAAALILLLIDPLYIAEPSFILSFASVAGLLGMTRLFIPRRIFRIQTFLFTPVFWLVSVLAASLSAQLATLAAVACLFSELPTYSLLNNLPALPLITLALPFMILSVILGFILPAAGKLIAYVIGQLLELLLGFAAQISTLPLSGISSPVWTVPLIVLFTCACVMCLSITKTRRRTKRIFAALLPVIALCALLRPLTYPKDGLEVLFLDAGQADAALIRAETQYYLMDTGEDSTAADYLRAQGIRPAGIFISHPHSDHAGGLKEILDQCPPAVIYLPIGWNSVEADEGIPELIALAQAKGWIVRTLSAGNCVLLSDQVRAEVYQPWEGMTDDSNGASLVMHVSFKNPSGKESSVLFTGDLPTDDEYAFFPDCDVLKVAHHGSKYSTSNLFLKMTSPSAAVIPVGYNSYGHPAQELLERLEGVGCEVYRTDQNGAVSILFGADGSISVTPMKSNESEAAS